MSFLSAYRSLALLTMILLCQCKKEDDSVAVNISDQNFPGSLLEFSPNAYFTTACTN